MIEKKEAYIIAGCVCIVSALCFAFGITVGLKKEVYVLVIEPTGGEDVSIASRVLVSSRGRVYYPWWCSAGENIAVQNRRWFSTPLHAERAGYSISKVCSVK